VQVRPLIQLFCFLSVVSHRAVSGPQLRVRAPLFSSRLSVFLATMNVSDVFGCNKQRLELLLQLSSILECSMALCKCLQ